MLGGCGHHAGRTAAAAPVVSGSPPGSISADPSSAAASASPSTSPSPKPSAGPKPKTLPSPGNPAGHATIPADARAVDTSHPTHKIGTGTPAGCTSAAVVKAVGQGGII